MEVNSEVKTSCVNEPQIKRFKHSTISECINSQEFQDLFSKHWHEREHLETTGLSVLTEPFRLAKISNFISSESFMEDLKVELAEVKSRRQSLDLYQFEQTSDLADVDTPSLRRLWETFQRDFCDWMRRNTKIELNKKISMSSSVYYDTDYLLCHDDNLGDRRIAFILYLSKDWSLEDGGTLDLFDTDENGVPNKIVRSLVPEYNSLIFFEVHDDSYHQVSEVKSPEKSRWTINGWFHGPVVPSARKPRPEIQFPLHTPQMASADIRSWIRNYYLDSTVAKNVQKNVETNSYTFLSNFFVEETWEILSKQIVSDEIVWSRVGPPDVRNYEIAKPESLPKELAEFYQLFSNIEIFKLLKEYTELDLVPNIKAEGDPRMSVELQRWSNGCYTLMCDRSHSEEEERLSSICDDEIFAMSEDEDVPSMSEVMRIAAQSEREMLASMKEQETTASNGSEKKLSTEGLEKKEEIKETTKEEKKCEDSSTIGTDESADSAILKRLLKGKSKAEKKSPCSNNLQQASCSSIEEKSVDYSKTESEDSDVSDIGDYLSDRFERSIDNSDEDDNEDEEDDCATSPSTCEPGSLDVIVQFNTSQAPPDETIDYIDPNQQEGALIHVPFKDNHLCLAYKTIRTSRLHKYVNHYCKGYFYNLICTYYE
ncbi:prolyl 3-hydroxylase OGFOD1 [Venturia canescens]|uniref:prolyl 3-hydroxylase OGFOD1 n=1 Tax=Venturia canescens TaxID=32260 RepID=UPI001C9D4816|nr:prolyl 3-hydroxylase OGFOD1 [Venturia canescens]XP_043288749.1 prolyl 3-hydroxylase OGFOD1 [Venturia canescens]